MTIYVVEFKYGGAADFEPDGKGFVVVTAYKTREAAQADIDRRGVPENNVFRVAEYVRKT